MNQAVVVLIAVGVAACGQHDPNAPAEVHLTIRGHVTSTAAAAPIPNAVVQLANGNPSSTYYGTIYAADTTDALGSYALSTTCGQGADLTDWAIWVWVAGYDGGGLDTMHPPLRCTETLQVIEINLTPRAPAPP